MKMIIFTYFIRSFTIYKFFKSNDKYQFITYNKLYNNNEWMDYSHEKLRKGFKIWLLQEAENIQQARLKTKVNQTLLRLNLRPGDMEKYVRQGGGVKASDANTVIEHCRTPLQSSWWNLKILKDGIVTVIKNWYDGVPHRRIIDAIVLKIFSQDLETQEQFPMWSLCVLLEWDFVNYIDRLSLQEEPIIIQFMGEFNVWYDKTLFCTKEIDAALIFWVLIMKTERSNEFKSINQTWTLNTLPWLLENWKELSYKKFK